MDEAGAIHGHRESRAAGYGCVRDERRHQARAKSIGAHGKYLRRDWFAERVRRGGGTCVLRVRRESVENVCAG